MRLFVDVCNAHRVHAAKVLGHLPQHRILPETFRAADADSQLAPDPLRRDIDVFVQMLELDAVVIELECRLFGDARQAVPFNRAPCCELRDVGRNGGGAALERQRLGLGLGLQCCGLCLLPEAQLAEQLGDGSGGDGGEPCANSNDDAAVGEEDRQDWDAR